MNAKVKSSDKITELKAVFIAKIAEFVTWPNQSEMSDTSKEFIIKVLGDEALYKELDEIYSQSSVKIFKKRIEVKHINSLGNLGKAHILFVSSSYEDSLNKIYNYVKEKPILTISDSDGFAEKNIQINFYVRGDERLHFEINEECIRNSPLIVSAKLLSIAKIVKSK